MPDLFFDFCYNVNLIVSNDDHGDYKGCEVANEVDEFETYAWSTSCRPSSLTRRHTG